MALLSTLSSAKLHVGNTDTGEDTFLTQVLSEADALIKSHVRQQWTSPPAIYTDYIRGRNTPHFRLREGPVRVFLLTGTLASGSAVVSGISSTTGLVAGMPVSVTAASTTAQNATLPIPAGTTISSVDSATQVTLSAAATVTGAYPLVFGIAVYVDRTGGYGAGAGVNTAGPFAGPNAQLIYGQDYALRVDMADNTSSRSRLVERLNGVWQGSFVWTRGLLTTELQASRGSIKAIYCAGFTSIPADLELACNLVVATLRRMRQGGIISSESYDGYSVQVTGPRKGYNNALDPVIDVLARWGGSGLSLGV